jgi:hypothetical protein
MADKTVQESLDEIVKAVGFGIVSDFRELYDSMREISSDIRGGNEILDRVTKNTEDISKTLDNFQNTRNREKQVRATREAEDKLEGRTRLNAQRSEEALQKIQKTLDGILNQVKMGGGQSSGDGSIVDDVAGAAVGAGAAAAGGSFLKGAARLAGRAGIVGGAIAGAAAIGAAGAYMMGGGDTGGEEGGSLGPASGPAGTASVPTPAGDIARMGGATAAVGASAGAAAVISRSTMSAKQKALAKIGPKVPTYLSKFGGRIATVIGLKSIPIFGALVGGYFSFSRFMSGDSWQAIGAEFASGIAPDVGALGGPAGYVAGVASTLAIQTYLICRDIYQEENAIDIKNNVVPNFDDLTMAEKSQVLNSVRGYVESYVNGLIGRSKTSDATTGIAPTSTSGAALSGADLAGAAAAGGAGANLAGAADSSTGGGSQMQGPPAPGGITTGAAQNIADQRATTPQGQTPTTTPQQTAYSQNLFGSSPAQASPAASPQVRSDVGDASQQSMGGSPSDTVATFNTSSDQTSMYSGGSLEELKAEIARGEGDYASYNRGVAGDTPAGNRSIDIQNLTVGQVMELQSQRKLFAVGKYQFIPGTLREAVAYTGIDTSRKFDASTQEQLFPYLISDAKRPKLAGYISGRHDNVDAALNDLAAEFASIPQSNGRGRYDGDNAGNRAAGGLQRAEKIKSILQGIKQGGGTGATAMADGALVTPLSADKPKAGRDLSMELQPPRETAVAGDENMVTTSQNPIDARKKVSGSGVPKETIRNSISTYAPYMNMIFGSMTEELKTFASGEHTSTKLFEDAMNPLS